MAVSFISILKSSIERIKSENRNVSNNSEELFKEYYLNTKTEIKNEIPKFYTKMPLENDQIGIKFREESRAVFLQQKTKELPDNDDIEHLHKLLKDNDTLDGLDEEKLINYEDFLKMGICAGEKFNDFFTPVVFCKLLDDDPYGQISIDTFFSYVMKKIWIKQTRIGLSLYDLYGYGFLQDSHLETYIKDLMSELIQISDMEKSFHSFYVCTVVRKFFFFLDPLRTNKIKIADILASNFLDELLELREPNLPKEHLQKNWFSSYSALKVYGIFLNLDKDRNGMLSTEELKNYGMGSLTEVFIRRVFQECVTYNGEMDYKTYLDFVLAIENQKEPQSLSYLFKILDINKKGYLTRFEINYFHKDVQNEFIKRFQDPVPLEDLCDEIFDMVRPSDPTKITLNELIDCGHGDVVTGILIDFNSFWNYETRQMFHGDNDKEPNNQ